MVAFVLLSLMLSCPAFKGTRYPKTLLKELMVYLFAGQGLLPHWLQEDCWMVPAYVSYDGGRMAGVRAACLLQFGLRRCEHAGKVE